MVLNEEWLVANLVFSKRLTTLQIEMLMYNGLSALTLQSKQHGLFSYIVTLHKDNLNIIVSLIRDIKYYVEYTLNPVITYAVSADVIQIENDLFIAHPDSDETEGRCIYIERNSAFGTGRHPSTQLLLRWLYRHDCHNLQICDFGCGSGILGIYAKMKKAKRVLCVDIDNDAILCTQYHASLNNVIVDVATHLNKGEKFDVIVSNCERKVLLEVCGEIEQSLASGGLWVITGIISRVWLDIKRAIPPWEVIEQDKIGQWVLKVLIKP